MKGDGQKSYDQITVFLHWVIALLIFALLGLGYIMTGLPTEEATLMFNLYQLHKSLGICVLILSAARLIWRFFRVPPVPLVNSKWEMLAAKITHIALYSLILTVPLLGWALVSASPYNIPTLIFGQIEWPHIAVLANLTDKETAETALKLAHTLAAYGLLTIALMHVAAALRHHFILKDTTLSRMIPFLRTNQIRD